MIDYSALWDEEASFESVVETYQRLIDTGQVWFLEGHVGRTADELIDAGYCMLSKEPRRNYYGILQLTRYQVEPGSVGSPEYVAERKTNH